MALMKISEYRKKFFAQGSAPCSKTIVKQIMNEEIYGEKQGGLWFVDPTRIVPKNDNIAKILSHAA
jgi:hypothetical protein